MHRRLLSHPIFKSGDAYLIKLYLYILLKVNHRRKKFLWNGNETIINRGEGIFGLNKITFDLTGFKGIAGKKFKRFRMSFYRKLKLLQKLQFIELRSTNKFTIVKVTNWSKYQRKVINRKGWVNINRKFLFSNVFQAKDPILTYLALYIILRCYYRERHIILDRGEFDVKMGQGVFGGDRVFVDLAGIKEDDEKNKQKLFKIFKKKLEIFQNLKFLTKKQQGEFIVVSVVNKSFWNPDVTQLKLNCKTTVTQLLTNKKLEEFRKNINISKFKKINTFKKFKAYSELIVQHAKNLYPNKNCKKAMNDFIEYYEIHNANIKRFDLAFYKWVREDRHKKYKQAIPNISEKELTERILDIK
ncbi:MAG: hypothetical protein ACFFDH_00165 [Promethearchaeota archaeon]